MHHSRAGGLFSRASGFGNVEFGCKLGVAAQYGTDIGVSSLVQASFQEDLAWPRSAGCVVFGGSYTKNQLTGMTIMTNTKHTAIRPLKDSPQSKVPKYAFPFKRNPMTREEASPPAVQTIVMSALMCPRRSTGSRREYCKISPSPAVLPICRPAMSTNKGNMYQFLWVWMSGLHGGNTSHSCHRSTDSSRALANGAGSSPRVHRH